MVEWKLTKMFAPKSLKFSKKMKIIVENKEDNVDRNGDGSESDASGFKFEVHGEGE